MKHIETNGTIDLFDDEILKLDLKECIFKYENHEFMLTNALDGVGLSEQIKTIRAFLNGEKVQIISKNGISLLKEWKHQLGGGELGIMFSVLIDKNICHYPIIMQCTNYEGVLTEIKTDSAIVYNKNHFIIMLKDLTYDNLIYWRRTI